MKVAVVYKWSRNAADALVRADGSIDWRGAKMSAGEDDPAALAASVQIAADAGAELVGVTIGDGDASWVLARGVEGTVSVTDAPPLADNAATAAILAAAVRSIGDVDVVVIGDSRQDSGVAPALAGHLGWPAVLGVETAAFADGAVQATRRVDDRRETVAVAAPAVLGVAADADVDRTPGMKEMLAARKRPVTKVTLADLGVAAEDVESAGFSLPETAPARVFDGEPAEAAAQLVAALRAEGVL